MKWEKRSGFKMQSCILFWIFQLALGDEVKLLMKGATTHHDDEYLTTSIPVDLAFGLNDLTEEIFVHQIKVQTDGKVHHIIVKGCSDVIHKIQELDKTCLLLTYP